MKEKGTRQRHQKIVLSDVELFPGTFLGEHCSGAGGRRTL